MKEKLYFIGAIVMFVFYYLITLATSYYWGTTIPLIFSNTILFPVWMNYVNKKWKEK